MGHEQPKREPTPEEKAKLQAAYAKFMKEKLEQSAYDAFVNLQPEDLIDPDPEAEILKGTANQPSAWGHSPAHFELNAGADNRLTRCLEWAGISGNLVLRVHAKLIRGTKYVALMPADPNDLTALEVKRYTGQSNAWVNLITLLGPAGMTIESGYRELFYTAYIPKESKLWPGLFIDLGKALKRRLESKATEEENAEGSGDKKDDGDDE